MHNLDLQKTPQQGRKTLAVMAGGPAQQRQNQIIKTVQNGLYNINDSRKYWILQ